MKSGWRTVGRFLTSEQPPLSTQLDCRGLQTPGTSTLRLDRALRPRRPAWVVEACYAWAARVPCLGRTRAMLGPHACYDWAVPRTWCARVRHSFACDVIVAVALPNPSKTEMQRTFTVEVARAPDANSKTAPQHETSRRQSHQGTKETVQRLHSHMFKTIQVDSRASFIVLV